MTRHPGHRVGVRELKNRLSRYLQVAKAGGIVTVTERGHPVALLSSVSESPETRAARELVSRGLASWSGGKPRGAARRHVVQGKTLSQIVIEERR